MQFQQGPNQQPRAKEIDLRWYAVGLIAAAALAAVATLELFGVRFF